VHHVAHIPSRLVTLGYHSVYRCHDVGDKVNGEKLVSGSIGDFLTHI
jgi:hypothetical protein